MSMRLLLALPLLALAAGCAPTGANYPSLAPRPAEKQSFAEPETPPPAEAQPDPALDARVATALKSLDERITAFDKAAAEAAKKITAASRAAPGSDPWLDAQVALAELDGARSGTLEVVSDLDDMAGERATALQPDYPALDAAVTKGRAAAEAQRAKIAELQRGLAPA